MTPSCKSVIIHPLRTSQNAIRSISVKCAGIRTWENLTHLLNARQCQMFQSQPVLCKIPRAFSGKERRLWGYPFSRYCAVCQDSSRTKRTVTRLCPPTVQVYRVMSQSKTGKPTLLWRYKKGVSPPPKWNNPRRLQWVGSKSRVISFVFTPRWGNFLFLLREQEICRRIIVWRR